MHIPSFLEITRSCDPLEGGSANAKTTPPKERIPLKERIPSHYEVFNTA